MKKTLKKIVFIKKTFFLLPDMVEKFEKRAAKLGITPSQLLRDVLAEYFTRNPR